MTEVVGNVTVPIDDSEFLLRAVSRPAGLDKENRATPLAFQLRAEKKESELSLSRSRFEPLLDFLRRSLKINFRFLGKKNVPAGAIELRAKDVRLLDEHIILIPTPHKKLPSHASIIFTLEDGSRYIPSIGSSLEPVDSAILGYEMALASIVQKVYDIQGNPIWQKERD